MQSHTLVNIHKQLLPIFDKLASAGVTFTNAQKGEWDGNSFALTSVESNEKLAVSQPGPVKNQHYSIRTKDYRYIYYRIGDEEFYDHILDPFEWNNQANNHNYSNVKKMLNEEIMNIIKYN